MTGATHYVTIYPRPQQQEYVTLTQLIMNFTNACEIIRDALQDNSFKVIHPYLPGIPWSFKFERKGKQYDALDLLYLKITNKQPKLWSQMSRELPLHISDQIVLAQLGSGAWKKFDGLEREKYEQKRIEFESITGVKVK